MPQNENLSRTIVVIYVWHGKAYLPTQARFESGIYVAVEPVHIASLNAHELSRIILDIKGTKLIRLPSPKAREEFQARKQVVLETTGARSWKQLAQSGVAYTIGWKENVRIDMSRLDKKGRWENDPDKVRTLPLDTPVERIVEIILEDLKTRPEALKISNY